MSDETEKSNLSEVKRALSESLDMLKDNIRKDTGELIKTAREEEGLTQKELSQLLDRRQAYVSDLENGKTSPDVNMLIALSVHLRKPVDFFIPTNYRAMFSPSKIERGQLSPEEEDLITRLRAIEPGWSRGLAIHMVKAVLQWDEKYMEWLNNS